MKAYNANAQLSKPSYFYSIVSITLVLFMLGLLGLILLQAQTLSAHFKENLEITLILADDATLDEMKTLQNTLNNKKYTKNSEIMTKEEAIKQFMVENKEDVINALGYNPLFSSINLYLKAPYANTDSLQIIKKDLKNYAVISDIFYQEALLEMINVNAGKVGLVLFVLSIIFLIIAFTLIDNTIKLAMYANRFLVKSMQLVGATRWFIAAPFIAQSVYNGALGGLIASALLAMLVVIAQSQLPELSLLHHPAYFVLLCIVVTGIGVAISWWSTRQSVIKYLQSSLDELY